MSKLYFLPKVTKTRQLLPVAQPSIKYHLCKTLEYPYRGKLTRPDQISFELEDDQTFPYL